MVFDTFWSSAVLVKSSLKWNLIQLIPCSVLAYLTGCTPNQLMGQLTQSGGDEYRPPSFVPIMSFNNFIKKYPCSDCRTIYRIDIIGIKKFIDGLQNGVQQSNGLTTHIEQDKKLVEQTQNNSRTCDQLLSRPTDSISFLENQFKQFKRKTENKYEKESREFTELKGRLVELEAKVGKNEQLSTERLNKQQQKLDEANTKIESANKNIGKNEENIKEVIEETKKNTRNIGDIDESLKDFFKNLAKLGDGRNSLERQLRWKL